MESKINQLRMNARFNEERDLHVLDGKEMKDDASEAG